MSWEELFYYRFKKKVINQIFRTTIMINLYKILILLVSLGTIGCSNPGEDATDETHSKEQEQWLTHVDAEAASKLLETDPKPTVLDIRRGFEFQAGNIPGAVSLDFYGEGFKDELGKHTKNKPILVHCASGGRSTESLKHFKALGFQEVIHLDGGFKAWQAAGLPVEKQ